MPPSTLFCPKCGTALTIPHPAPEKVVCPKCRAGIRIASPARIGAAAKPAARQPAVAGAQVQMGKGGAPAGLRIQDELASGGLGVVYLAYHLHFKDFRAVKRPRTDVGLDRDVLLARFRREVEALGGLYSPHVVRAYDAGADDQGPYLITEYLDGAPLSRLVDRRRQLPVAEACELARQAALGLQAAHERGLVHRDVKPSNLMLARDGADSARVVVIDWGLVKRAGESAMSNSPPAPALTGLGSAIGTADYMAPEQVGDARSVDTRADVYSLGATLYFLLAGKPPFSHKSDLEKLLAHQREAFPPLDHLRADLPRELTAVLRRMVEKDPARRYATPGDAATALQPFCQGVAAAQFLSLLDLSAGRPAEPALDTKDVFQQKTELAHTPTPAAGYPAAPTPAAGYPAAPDQRFAVVDAGRAPAPAPAPIPTAARPSLFRIGLLLVAGAVGLLLVVGTLAITVWALSGGPSKDKDNGSVAKDGKTSPTPGEPQVLIDEDFSKAIKNSQTLPDGWSGDAFRVVKDHDEPCLEVSKPSGIYFVTLPPVTLSGDFSIEAACIVDAGRPLIVRLESRKTNALLPVTLSHDGQIAIGDDRRLAPPNFKIYQPVLFLLKREGKKMRVFLNGEVAADKDLDAVTEFESLQLGMGGGVAVIPGGSKVFRLKVVALPAK